MEDSQQALLPLLPPPPPPPFDDETIQRRYQTIKSRICLTNSSNSSTTITTSSSGGGVGAVADGITNSTTPSITINQDDADAICWILAEGGGCHHLPLDDDGDTPHDDDGGGDDSNSNSNINAATRTPRPTISFQRPRLNDHGRVTTLRVGGNFRDPNVYFLSKSVARLHCLKSLVLVNVRVIPKELSQLQHLEKLWIFWNNNSNNRNRNHNNAANGHAGSGCYFPPIHLPNLKSLHIEGVSTTHMLDIARWMERSTFPNLDELSLGVPFSSSSGSSSTCNDDEGRHRNDDSRNLVPSSHYSYNDLERILRAVCNDSRDRGERGPTRLELVESEGITNDFDKLMCETIPDYAPTVERLCIAPFHGSIDGDYSSSFTRFSLKPLADRLSPSNTQKRRPRRISKNFYEWSRRVRALDITYTSGVLDLYVADHNIDDVGDDYNSDVQNENDDDNIAGGQLGNDPATRESDNGNESELTEGNYDSLRRTTYVIQNEVEKRSMVTILKIFKRLSSFGSTLRLLPTSTGTHSTLDGEIAYWMRINHGGRALLESSPDTIPGMGGVITNNYCSSETIGSLLLSSHIPLSLWSHVLERSSKCPTVCAGSDVPAMIESVKERGGQTCMYYLLRNGPALLQPSI